MQSHHEVLLWTLRIWTYEFLCVFVVGHTVQSITLCISNTYGKGSAHHRLIRLFFTSSSENNQLIYLWKLCINWALWFVHKTTFGNSLVVQWLGLWASISGDMGCIPGWGTKIPHAAGCGKKKNIKLFFSESMMLSSWCWASTTNELMKKANVQLMVELMKKANEWICYQQWKYTLTVALAALRIHKKPSYTVRFA